MIPERISGRHKCFILSYFLGLPLLMKSLDESIHRLDHMNNSGRLSPVVFVSESV